MKEMQYLQGRFPTAVDTSSYDQIHMSTEVLGEMIGYLVPDALIQVGIPGGAGRHDFRRPSTLQGNGARHQGRYRRNDQTRDARASLVVNVPPFINEATRSRQYGEGGPVQGLT